MFKGKGANLDKKKCVQFDLTNPGQTGGRFTVIASATHPCARLSTSEI